jgi:hypothetical protein
MWRLPKDRDEDDAAGGGVEDNSVQIYLPHNYRDAPPPDAIIEEPPVIEAEPVDTTRWIRRKVT